MTRFIFITGGVVSSLGKGLASAALGAVLQARGYKVRLRKLDPYLNVDPGTMSPYQHGEVYVTDDGAETDLDLGHYERFTGVASRKSDNVTSGQIYQQIISAERRGDYLGGTVQVIRTLPMPSRSSQPTSRTTAISFSAKLAAPLATLRVCHSLKPSDSWATTCAIMQSSSTSHWCHILPLPVS